MSLPAYSALRFIPVVKLELVLDVPASYELEGQTVAISVARGIGNVLPPRWDPWFKNRLRRVSSSVVLDAGSPPHETGRSTKIDVVLSALKRRYAATVAAVDLDQSGSRLCLRTRDRGQDADSLGPASDGIVIVGSDTAASTQLGVSPATTTIALIGLSRAGAAAELAVHTAMTTVCSACGGREVARMSFLVLQEHAPVLIPLPS